MPTARIRVLVTGATGAIGPRVVYALIEAGYDVRTFSIDPALGIFPPQVEVIVGDIMDKESVTSAMQGVDAIVHLAAILHIINPSPILCADYERINVGGTATVVESALDAGVKQVVLFSTITVYGQARGQVLNERSHTRPETYYARTKLAAEQVVLNAKRKDGHPLGTVLRLGAVYGSRIKGNYYRLTHALARHRFISIGSELNRRTLIYDKDVGRAVVQTIINPQAAGQVFNVTDGRFHTLREIIESICSALGRKPPQLSFPIYPNRALMGLIDKGSRIIGIRSPVTKDMIDKYSEDIAVDGTLIQKELAFIPKYDLKAGWKEAIEEMRARGVL